MKNLVSLILPLMLSVFLSANALADESKRGRSNILLAQNTPAQKDAEKKDEPSESTPLPPPRSSFSTEKPVKNIPGITEKIKAVEQATDPAPAQVVETPDTTQSTASEQAKTPGTTVPTPGVTVPPVPSATVPGAAASAVAGAIPGAASDAVQDSTAQSRAGVPPDINEQIAKQRAQELAAAAALEKTQESKFFSEELSIVNVSTGNLRTMKYVIDDLYRLKGMVYGEEQGYIHILDADDDGNFKEVWKSPPTNSPIRGLFVRDLEGDGGAEVIAYTADGNIFIYDYKNHDLIYRTPEGTYQNINCMVIDNMDSDPQLELFFIGVKPGAGGGSGNPAGVFIQFDPKSKFEEWTSSDQYTATDMLIGNVDNDPEAEIILNTGEILSKQFKDVEWKSTIELGSRIYLVDMDSDGILELVTEVGESFVKIIDVDQRREKW